MAFRASFYIILLFSFFFLCPVNAETIEDAVGEGTANPEQSPSSIIQDEIDDKQDKTVEKNTFPDKIYHLSMASIFPANNYLVTEGHGYWIREIEKRSQGRVKIDLLGGDSIVIPEHIYWQVTPTFGVSVSVDIGITHPSYLSFPTELFEAFELPGYNNDNALVASMTVQEGYKRIFELPEFEEDEKVKVLLLWAAGPSSLLTLKPVHRLEDLKDMKIQCREDLNQWSVTSTRIDFSSIQELGAYALLFPTNASYFALQQNIVQGILSPTDVLQTLNLSEVVNHIIHTPFLANTSFVKIMNIDTWNSLPPDIQQIFEEVSAEAVEMYGRLLTDYSRRSLESAIESYGVEVITLSEEEQKRWVKKLVPVVENWLRKDDRFIDRYDIKKQAIEIFRDCDAYFSEKYGDY